MTDIERAEQMAANDYYWHRISFGPKNWSNDVWKSLAEGLIWESREADVHGANALSDEEAEAYTAKFVELALASKGESHE